MNNLTEAINSTILGTTTTTTTSTPGGTHYVGLKFGEDGVRQPPSVIASSNVIIMVVGLSLLIVPIVGFLVCMIAKSRVLKNLRGMKFTSDVCSAGGGGGADGGGEGDSGLPYSQFESDPEDDDDYEASSPTGNKRKKKRTTVVDPQQNKDVRVLIHNDNTFVGSPTRKNGNSQSQDAALLKRKISASSSSNLNSGSSVTVPLTDDTFATLDVDATFIINANRVEDVLHHHQPSTSHHQYT